MDGINNPCPIGYRIPTAIEWETERLSWVDSNIPYTEIAFSSVLKLSSPGIRTVLGSGNYGSQGSYWSSTVDVSSAILSSVLIWDKSYNYDVNLKEIYIKGSIKNSARINGFSCRCIKD